MTVQLAYNLTRWLNVGYLAEPPNVEAADASRHLEGCELKS